MIMRAAVVTFLVCLPFVSSFAEDAPSAELSAEDRERLITLLDESFTMLQGLITGLSEEQWTFKENADRWSVGECTEHIVRSERALLDFAKQALAGEPDPEWAEKTKGKTDLLTRVMPNRNPGGAGGAQAPMEIRPTEKWDRAKAIQELYIIRGEVRAMVETIEGPVKSYTAEHPFPVFGWLTAEQWLLYVPLHTVRHSRQIIEVQEAEGYPKG